MNHEVLVDFENVSKRFCRGLRRSLFYGVRDLAKELACLSKEENALRKEEFWALNNVSFQLKKGESLGLIGRNGAGKTTILRLINGLIKPTKGRIEVNGSIRALIALGIGFNPILTGRENIKIACSVLGYTKKEMEEKYDEIVDFSEIGEFINAPVQSYSSGMLVRLGFSVAINTNPDILLVDEVLAVGDLNFAIKCYRKISDYRNQAGSIILVSHNMYAIRTNCDRAIWIHTGKIQKAGKADEVCNAYEKFAAREDKAIREKKYIDQSFEVLDVSYPSAIQGNEEFSFEFVIKARRVIERPIIAVSIFDIMGHNLISNFSEPDDFIPMIQAGMTKIRIKYKSLFLSSGMYHVNLVIAEKYINNQLAAFVDSFRFEVKSEEKNYGAGYFQLQPTWECHLIEKR